MSPLESVDEMLPKPLHLGLSRKRYSDDTNFQGTCARLWRGSAHDGLTGCFSFATSQFFALIGGMVPQTMQGAMHLLSVLRFRWCEGLCWTLVQGFMLVANTVITLFTNKLLINY